MKVLVANRGEIACRIFAAVRERGYRSVAVASDADLRARHVRHADEVVSIGPAPATESYLDIEKVVAAAKSAGATAVHPGYGFLAENAAFAAAVEAAGLVFLGPTAETIDLLGDKRRARAVADRAGVPVVPGWEGDPSDLAAARAAAAEIGFPVLVKAALGGGGKGMTRVDSEAELDAALEAAARVAASAFGDASVFLEKAILAPRHVEVQLLGDGQGEVLHLGERECSLQRRHQKVIEESPATTIEATTRERLLAAAVAIGREVNYRSAGTCEFLVAPDQSFYFLEVNARVQVEHPVSELVTGRDVLHAQFDLVETGKLPFAQEDIWVRGYAVEARVYAEDPDADFLPQSGPVLRADFPSAPWLRIDAGVDRGDEITTHYDPMIAKVIAYGDSREVAWSRLARALEETVVHGPGTNLAFLRDLVTREDARAGDYHVTSIEEKILPERAARLASEGDEWLLAAAAVAEHFGSTPAAAGGEVAGPGRSPDPFDSLLNWRLGAKNGGAA